MFFKLIKYDLRAAVKKFGIIVPAVLALSLLGNLLVRLDLANFDPSDPMFSSNFIVGMFSGMGWLILLLTMVILATVFIIQRFYQGLLQDEGYLVHSLPVKTWKLVLSKFLTSMLLILVMHLLVIVSLFLFAGDTWFFKDFVLSIYTGDLVTGPMQEQILESTGSVFWANVLRWGHYIFTSIVNAAYPVLTVYLSMAMGHLFNKNRGVMSFILYIVIFQMAIPTLLSIPTAVVLFTTGSISPIISYTTSTLLPLVLQFAICIACYFGTVYILTKHLDLE